MSGPVVDSLNPIHAAVTPQRRPKSRNGVSRLNRGILFVVSGASGVGKGSILSLVLASETPERVAGFYLWRGRAYDTAVMRSAARADYSEAANGTPDQSVAKAARDGQQHPWRWRRLALEFNYAEAI